MKRPVCVGQLYVEHCVDCNQPLHRDEVAISRRLIGRGITRYCCIGCLAERLKVDPTVIKLKIQEYRELGCSLFTPVKGGM